LCQQFYPAWWNLVDFVVLTVLWWFLTRNNKPLNNKGCELGLGIMLISGLGL
jgi:hypothetical protein